MRRRRRVEAGADGVRCAVLDRQDDDGTRAVQQQQMGHASIQQTVDTYGSWLPIRVPGAVDTLADATAPSNDGHLLDTCGVLEASGGR